MKPALTTTAILGLALAATWSANAQAQITLKVADSFPAGHYVTRYMTKPWMEEVTEKTGGKVKFEHYPAEQLGKLKDMLMLAQSGVTDIAYVVPSIVPDKMPLSPVAELPLPEAVGCNGAMAYYKVVNQNSQLRRLDFEANKVRPILVQNLPPVSGLHGQADQWPEGSAGHEDPRHRLGQGGGDGALRIRPGADSDPGSPRGAFAGHRGRHHVRLFQPVPL